jgi:hypothetical protein
MAGQDYAGLMLLIMIFGIVLGILGLLMPFFVLRIRNEMIALNKSARQIVYMLEAEEERRGKPNDAS